MRDVLSFEDIKVGMVAKTVRTFIRADIEAFGTLAPDRAAVHFDRPTAKRMGYRDVIVFGWLAGAPFSGLLGMELPGPRTVLHSVRIQMVRPVYPDEPIEYCVEVKQVVAAMKAVVLDLVAARAADKEVVIRGQAQCGFRS
jgi:acyl dehydratase